jgi:hypothetical protein
MWAVTPRIHVHDCRRFGGTFRPIFRMCVRLVVCRTRHVTCYIDSKQLKLIRFKGNKLQITYQCLTFDYEISTYGAIQGGPTQPKIVSVGPKGQQTTAGTVLKTNFRNL